MTLLNPFVKDPGQLLISKLAVPFLTGILDSPSKEDWYTYICNELWIIFLTCRQPSGCGGSGGGQIVHEGDFYCTKSLYDSSLSLIQGMDNGHSMMKAEYPIDFHMML